MKTSAKAYMLMFCISLCTGSFADWSLQTNMYARINSIYESSFWTPELHFQAVRGGGFANDGMSDQFLAFCVFVSNRCDEIIAEWPAYETNEVARFTVQSAIGYTGFSNLTNLAERVLSLYENDSDSISESTLEMVKFPYGTPFAAENYLAFNYDVPGVSNIINRIRSIAEANSNTNVVSSCDRILSGESRQWLQLMMEAGAL
jgi:hypothetical protein